MPGYLKNDDSQESEVKRRDGHRTHLIRVFFSLEILNPKKVTSLLKRVLVIRAGWRAHAAVNPEHLLRSISLRRQNYLTPRRFAAARPHLTGSTYAPLAGSAVAVTSGVLRAPPRPRRPPTGTSSSSVKLRLLTPLATTVVPQTSAVPASSRSREPLSRCHELCFSGCSSYSPAV
ncbi:hypothetical protein EVAR_6769_1 [Eumeta japonica]|uniref:Uncharacterized protein n=1 Tax=Eumeta variegata TaxID=151549 RepID=A0A4C1V3S0_EUMVA|nr:hypothetical protein EVAR_6769_1 [Eumeta japonica]